ncbi:MAG TPA: hypothetical protein DEP84_03655 [Chloroflexi bacterium]|nr:hypothetical protein [Chloroflexota bacterium]
MNPLEQARSSAQAVDLLALRPETRAGQRATLDGDHAPAPGELILLQGLTTIRQEQLQTGEIASYRRGPAGDLLYCRSPFVSTFVHDALGCFDPRSPSWQPHTLDLIPGRRRVRFFRTVIHVRQRIRAFLAWQQESDGCWRFFGRGSGLDCDANTTVCAASALLDRAERSDLRRWQRQVKAVLRFRSAGGLFFTFLTPAGRGYGWMDDVGRPVAGIDRVVNADVLRYLALAGVGTGRDVEVLMDYLRGEAASGDLMHGTSLYPNPLSFFYALTRAWDQAQLPGLADLASSLVPRLLSLQGEDGNFGTPLSTSLAIAAFLNLKVAGTPLERARDALISKTQPAGGWAYEDFIVSGFGSPALTTALAMMVLARSSGLANGWAG